MARSSSMRLALFLAALLAVGALREDLREHKEKVQNRHASKRAEEKRMVMQRAQDKGFGEEEDEDTECTNTCNYAYDSDCDDGGPDSHYSICESGTDCADCGPRTGGPEVPDDDADTECTNTCNYAYDSDCDDGGPDSHYSICESGTDCADCGPRGGPEPEPGCTDTCNYAYDYDCDDGGDNSDYSICGLGTDCSDCGPRAPEEPAEEPAEEDDESDFPVCPGQPSGNYCDGTGDCMNYPEWCCCPEGQHLCADNGYYVNDCAGGPGYFLEDEMGQNTAPQSKAVVAVTAVAFSVVVGAIALALKKKSGAAKTEFQEMI